LLLITTVVLGTFLFLAGLVLDRSFRVSVLDGAEEQLKLVIYSLMGSLEKDGAVLRFGSELPEPRLHQPESGLYAAVSGRAGSTRWESPSAITTAVPFPDPERLVPGEFTFVEHAGGDAVERFVLNYPVIWEDETVLDFAVATDQRPFQEAIAGFRRNLYIGLGAVTFFFVLAQVLAVRWGLRPLRTMAGEVRELQEGRREQLSAAYPVELEGLAENLDRFIAHEQRSRSRYRKAMEDLAHSLKTPLGAAVSGPVVVGRAVRVADLISRLLRALHTAYQDRGIEVELDLPDDLTVRGDERDLLEMFGNLLDNAFKYTRARVAVSGESGASMTLIVEDDGPGIDGELRHQVLNRGTRADEIQSGQGIGLAMVHELVSAYDGQLSIGESRWGGASIRLVLPS
jgi:two-component system sensor histidine kinase PhoQ